MGNIISRNTGNSVEFSEVVDTVQMVTGEIKRTHELQATPDPFPFMKLPSETRNEIYRLVLLAQSVTTCCRAPRQGAGSSDSIQPEDVAIGTVRCKPWRSIRCGHWRKYTLEYQTAILRVNRQINLETVGIFQIESFWTLVWVNKAGFGKEMKKLGFPVGIVGDQWHYIKFPVMKVTVSFPSLEDQDQSEILLVAKVHIKHLVRALWTAKGASDTEVKIHVQPRLLNKSPTERDLLEPFFKLRTIKKLVVSGVFQDRYIKKLTRAITTTNGMNQTVDELSAKIRRLQKYMKTGRWGHAIAEAESHATLMEDCEIVFGNRFHGIEPGIPRNIAVNRGKTSREIRVTTFLCLAEINIHVRRYAETVRLANSAKDLVFHYPPPLGDIEFEDEIVGSIYVLRARAFLGMGQAKLAWRDIENARRFEPDPTSLYQVKKAWHAKFNPSPPSPSGMHKPPGHVKDPQGGIRKW